MKVEYDKNGFYKLTSVPSSAVHWLKYEVDPLYRFYQDGAWYVHKKFLDAVTAVAACSGSQKVFPQAVGVAEDYAILHLQPDAPDAIIDAVWRKLAQLHHPDKGGDPETFKRYSAAYQRIKESR